MSTGPHRARPVQGVPRKDASSGERRKRWLLPAVVVIAAGGVYAASRALPIGHYLAAALEWTEGLGTWGYLVFGVVYVVATVFMLPGSILTLSAGFLFGLFWGTITVSIASTAGAAGAFLVGRTLARSWVARKLEGSPKFRAIDEAVAREGFKIVLLTRLSPVFPFVLLNYAYGLTKVGFWKYTLASWIGMLPGGVRYVFLGRALGSLSAAAEGEVETGVAGRIFFWAGLVVAVVVAVFVARVARKAMKGVVPPTGTDAMAGGAQV